MSERNKIYPIHLEDEFDCMLLWPWKKFRNIFYKCVPIPDSIQGTFLYKGHIFKRCLNEELHPINAQISLFLTVNGTNGMSQDVANFLLLPVIFMPYLHIVTKFQD